ncbi:MAG: ABC-2 family transporter protein [Planctomycetes bacterium]|jgi:ABC-2 type transport system permease protein|nr:ABC-2 family transporter protein [Planctomycetota bacterium]
MFKKYLAIINTEFERQMTYRIDFFGFRLANFLEIASQLVIWTVIYNKTEMVSGYTYEEMVTYVVVGWLFWFLTANYGFADNVARDIQLGRLSNFLLKPVSYIKYMTVLSLGRVSLALFSGVLLQAVVIVILHRIIVSPDFINILIIIPMIIVGYFVQLFLAVLTGFIAFWTTEINGIFRFIAVLTRFLSGTLFPISLLPMTMVKINSAFPFVYTFFVPTQLYLGKMSALEGLRGLGLEILWLFALYGIIKIVWRFGLKKYESVGI